MKILLQARRDNQFGGAITEFVVAAPIFLGFIFVSIELGFVAYKYSALNYAVTSALRWSTLGESVPGLSRHTAIEEKVAQLASAYGLIITGEQIYVCPPENAEQCDEVAFDGGGPGAYLQLSSRLPLQVFFGLYNTELKSSVFGRNEDFN